MSLLERWLGGSPTGVLLRLLFLSLVVGILLAAFELTPLGIVRQAIEALRSMFGYGLDAVRDFGRYVLTGALVVVPLFVLSRLLAARR